MAFHSVEYLDDGRFHSLGYQVREVLMSECTSALEVGIGPGLLPAVLGRFGVRVLTVDFDANLRPDVVAALPRLPVASGSVQTAVCFQTLEHLPLEQLEPALRELGRVADRHVVISVPNVHPTLRVLLRRCWQAFRCGRPWRAFGAFRRHPGGRTEPDHKWEIGWRAEVDDVAGAARGAGLTLVRSYRPPRNVYHHFFVFDKNADKDPDGAVE